MPELSHARDRIIVQAYREVLPAARSSNGTPLFDTACPDCGAVRLVDRRKIGKRCASCSGKARRTHGLCGSRLYRLLLNIRARCEYPTATNYAYYGGRGIKVCAEWREDPVAFVAWAEANGYADGLEIDRIDNDGDYCQENCRFVTHAENSQRRRNAKCTAEQAKSVRTALAGGASVRDAAEVAGVPYMSAWHIKSGNTWKAAA